MQQLIDVIGAAIATDATNEQKAAGAQACRTILTALGTEPGQPLVLPGTPRPHVLTGVSIDQVLELAIAKLSVIATDREKGAAEPAKPAATLSTATPTKALPSPGLRVPMVSSNALTQKRPATARKQPASAGRKP
ncbi:MAG: hypothetical protein AB7T06_10940 [Kofleriaceae bacterium]